MWSPVREKLGKSDTGAKGAGKLNKLMFKIEQPTLTSEGEKRLMHAQRNNRASR